MRLYLGILSLALSLYAGDTFVPAVTNERVDGAAQRVGLKIRNLETFPVRLSFVVLRTGEGESISAERTVDPLATLSLTDALNDLFPGTDPSGSLKIRADGATLTSAVRLFRKETRTYGVSLAAVAGESLTAPGAVADAPWLPTSEKWGSIFWLTLEGESAGTLVVYDSLGKELGRKEFEGTSRTLRFTPADLVVNPPNVVRVQVRMKKGLSTSFVETILHSTGDRSGYPAVEVVRLPRDVAFQPALRSPIVQGFALTSIVMFNPWASAMTATLSFAGRSSTVTLRPFEVREVVDAVSTLFASTNTASVLFASSSWPIFLAGRSDILPGPTGQTTAAEFNLAADMDDIAAGTVYMLPPDVPDAGLAFIASTREDASLGSVQGEDKAGFPMGAPGRYDLPDFVFWQTLLNTVAPDATASPVVTLKPETGGVRAAVQSFLPVSGDSLWAEARRAEPTPACAEPVVSKLFASAQTLAKPGQVAVTWEIERADTIELLPSGVSLKAAGTLNLDVGASAEFTFRAANACGTTEAPLFINVGAPQLTGAVAGQPGETKQHGAPGELLTVSFGNLLEPELIESLSVTTLGGGVALVEILGRGENGEVFALVPYVTAGTVTQQVTGEVQIRAVLSDGGASNAVPFTIDAIGGQGDGVAETRALVDRIASWMTETAAVMRTQGLPGVDDLVASSAREERELRAMLASIEATGKAVISYNRLPLTHPDAIGVEVTRADLAALMAINRSAGQAWRALLGVDPTENASAAASRLAATPPRSAGGTCLAQKVQLLEPCLKNDYRRKFEAAVSKHVDDFLKDIDKNLPQAKDKLLEYFRDKLAKKAIGAFSKRLYKWLDYLTVACLVAPIQLQQFELQTQGRVISKSPRRNRPLQNKEVVYSKYDDLFTVVRVMAVLVPEIPDGDVKSRARKSELAALRAVLKAKGVDDKTADMLVNMYDQTLESDPFMDELVRMAQKYRTTTRDLQQVGSCDLEHVYPKLNGPGAEGNPDVGYREGRSILKLYTGRQSGEDDYFYLGKRIKRRESLCIIPRDKHFLFDDNAAKVDARRLKNDPCAFHKEVTVKVPSASRQGDATTSVTRRQRIYSDRVFVGPGEARAVIANAAVGAPSAPGLTATPPINTVFVNTELDRDAPYVRKDGGGPASARIEATQTGDLTWKLKLNSSGHQEPVTLDNRERRFDLWTAYSMLELNVTYPMPPRETPRKVILTGKTQTDDLCQMFIRLGDGTQNKSVSGFEGNLSLDLESSGAINIVSVRVNVYVPNRGFQGPFVAKSSSCSGEAEIKIIEEDDSGPPPA